MDGHNRYRIAQAHPGRQAQAVGNRFDRAAKTGKPRLIRRSRAIGQRGLDVLFRRTVDGKLHACDIIVYATGFDAHAYIRPMKLTGEGGVTLDSLWSELPLTYRSVSIPHMPNFFLLNGPSSPGGSASAARFRNRSSTAKNAIEPVSVT